ncbi:MAG TPA: NUDIX domain-containing protein [Terriglobia bacterium]|nr:NUDIX domain-containing protein [Terriglobia bacterium]
MHYPVSIKGVLIEPDGVMLLENERAEWELPGGRLEPGETPQACLEREVEEELGISVAAGLLLDCWVYEVLPGRHVVIVTYGLRRRDNRAPRISNEHRRFGCFEAARLGTLNMPEGYRRSIRAWQSHFPGGSEDAVGAGPKIPGPTV